jgi:hypothetical protein
MFVTETKAKIPVASAQLLAHPTRAIHFIFFKSLSLLFDYNNPIKYKKYPKCNDIKWEAATSTVTSYLLTQSYGSLRSAIKMPCQLLSGV